MLCWLCFCLCFFFNDTATTEIYTLSLHDALPIYLVADQRTEHRLRHLRVGAAGERSEEHTSELQSRVDISYAVFCLKKTKTYVGRTLSRMRCCRRCPTSITVAL